MKRAFFFIGVFLFATTSFASIPRVSALDHPSPIAAPSQKTRIRVSDVLAPFERQVESELTRALRQAYGDASTTNASGLGRFLSVDPTWESADLGKPQTWNRYSYVLNNPVRYTDPDGRCTNVLDCTVEGAAVAGPTGAVVGAAVGIGIVYVGSKVNWGAAGEWLVSGGGGSSGEMAAERLAQNMSNHMAEKQDGAQPTTDPKRRFSKDDRQAGLDKSKDAEGTPRCEYCGNELNPNSGSGNSYEADHRTPHAQGGQSTQDNLTPSCRDCNRQKGNRTPEQWKKDKEKEQQ